MEQNDLGKYTRSFGLSFSITSLLSALLVILKETHEKTVLEWMKNLTSHHWITHGLINLILFVVLGFVLSNTNNGNGVNITSKNLVIAIAGAVVISGMIIAGFYIHD